eukprot:Platyproteum_vivax@DN10394_c0_g1_i1.p1
MTSRRMHFEANPQEKYRFDQNPANLMRRPFDMPPQRDFQEFPPVMADSGRRPNMTMQTLNQWPSREPQNEHETRAILCLYLATRSFSIPVDTVILARDIRAACNLPGHKLIWLREAVINDALAWLVEVCPEAVKLEQSDVSLDNESLTDSWILTDLRTEAVLAKVLPRMEMILVRMQTLGPPNTMQDDRRSDMNMWGGPMPHRNDINNMNVVPPMRAGPPIMRPEMPKFPMMTPMSLPSMPIPPSMPPISDVDINSLLAAPSSREKNQRQSNNRELAGLLAEPTARQAITIKKFKNQQGLTSVKEICEQGTRGDCIRVNGAPCSKVHFRKVILPHTELSLGDCSYLDSCRHMEKCKFVHYEVDMENLAEGASSVQAIVSKGSKVGPGSFTHDIGVVRLDTAEDTPAQWVTCDIRFFPFYIFKQLDCISIIMADPPWDIHMDLPYGTMRDTEMLNLKVQDVQHEGVLFLWVTGRAMELARDCMRVWGYRRVEELVWVKTNQLQRIIRTGRTGHWMNHSKEHCLVGMKGSPKVNINIDCDVLVSEVRETSRKPDEIYRLIERMAPGKLKLELFGRPHNVRNNWITLGNQLQGTHLHLPELIDAYQTACKDAPPPNAGPPPGSEAEPMTDLRPPDNGLVEMERQGDGRQGDGRQGDGRQGDGRQGDGRQ